MVVALPGYLRRVGVGIVVGLAVLSGCAGSPAAPAAPANDAALQRGREVFVQYCSTCHGKAGGGGAGPKLANGRVLRDFATIEAQVAFVKKGNGAMPAFASRLSDDDITDAVRFTREVLNSATG
jgi:mono/diheme cytochrome c family protein